MKPATLLETCKTLLAVLLEHDKFREEHFQQCLVSFGDSRERMNNDDDDLIIIKKYCRKGTKYTGLLRCSNMNNVA